MDFFFSCKKNMFLMEFFLTELDKMFDLNKVEI